MNATKELFDRFSLAFSVPVKKYCGEEMVFSCERAPFVPDPARLYLEPYIGGPDPICFVTSPDFIFCGYIALPTPDEYLIIGPALPYKLSRSQAEKVTHNLGLPHSTVKEIERLFFQLPVMSSPNFYSMMDFLRMMLDIDAPVKIVNPQISPARSIKPKTAFMDTTVHSGFAASLDEKLLSLISTGKVEELTTAFNSITSAVSSAPDLGPTAIRSMKNTFISATTVASRGAINGGLDYQTAASLTDLYITQVENMTSFSDIQQTFLEMLLDFTNRVRLARRPETDSATINNIYRDVQEHRYEKITTSDIAERLGVTKSYLCHHFKEKTGNTITQYIHKVKIEEAKYLLDTTDSLVSDISNELGYSSQQQFQHIFKSITGVSPQQYRGKSNAK